MSLSNADWVKLHLPKSASFTKNGVAFDIDSIVDSALSDAEGSKELALATLLDILAADIKFNQEVMGDYSYNGPNLADRAAYWREQAGTGTTPGSINFVDAVFEPEGGDENSR